MNIVEKFGRVLIPMCTPFKEDHSIDYDLAKKVARYLIDKKYCDSIIVAGTNGEFYTFTFEERVKLFEAIKDEVGDEIPLIAGTGTAFTGDTIKLTQEAERIGYDAAMVIVPYFSRPTQEGIFHHFSEVCENTSLPVMVYNIPLFTGANISPQTLSDLASRYENIVAVKDEAGINPLQASEFIRVTNGKVAVYSGDDLMVLAVLSQGGVGVVSGGSHVIGDLMHEVIDDFLSGKTKEAVALFKSLYKLFSAFFGKNRRLENPLPAVKAAFELESGLPVSRVRPPLMELSADEINTIKEALKNIGKL
ncbi:4-hydroxy-tetrahydrodipicolinate synthase [Kosmotoga pacifica]|uniref:4-hydroxy-tetrahydrodipicolinate synthase n=1 Tax=Kosmotoga pacifica TaxID=1330330 RepID=A0A0G2ZAE2_9BACT|nr:4-hydroxy-tetrahydrodipicolinate synthase [Kosmotoga pacifica]AKI97056.1 dihydrodipicolinate synthase [Kosmotoga pacifica]